MSLCEASISLVNAFMWALRVFLFNSGGQSTDTCVQMFISVKVQCDYKHNCTKVLMLLLFENYSQVKVNF